MCLALIGVRPAPTCGLVLGFNRDETYSRASRPFGLIDAAHKIYGGLDQKSQGTWLAIRTDGTFAALLHHRAPSLKRPRAQPRGELVCSFLGSQRSFSDFCSTLETAQYRPFYLIGGSLHAGFGIFSSLDKTVRPIKDPWQAISNGPPHKPWPKARALQQHVEKLDSAIFRGVDALHADLLSALSATKIYPDHELPHTGIPLEHERALSAAFIKTPFYGTVSQTVLTIDASKRHISITERITDPNASSVFTLCSLLMD